MITKKVFQLIFDEERRKKLSSRKMDSKVMNTEIRNRNKQKFESENYEYEARNIEQKLYNIIEIQRLCAMIPTLLLLSYLVKMLTLYVVDGMSIISSVSSGPWILSNIEATPKLTHHHSSPNDSNQLFEAEVKTCSIYPIQEHI